MAPRNMYSFVIDEGYTHPLLGDEFALISVVRSDKSEMVYVIALNDGEPYDAARFWVEPSPDEPNTSLVYTQTRDGLPSAMGAVLDEKLPLLCRDIAEAMGSDYIVTDPEGWVQ